MSTKVKNSKMEATRVIMTPLGSAASNVFNMLNMSFFLVFSTEALGLNIMIMGLVMTAMRIFDGITDPVIGSIIDRTETRFGKFRPFLVIGSLIMLLASFMIYLFSFDIPQSYRMVWVILWYAVWVVGYTFMTTVNKCVLSIVTKNPKYRPLSGVAGGCYSTLLSFDHDNGYYSDFTEKWWTRIAKRVDAYYHQCVYFTCNSFSRLFVCDFKF